MYVDLYDVFTRNNVNLLSFMNCCSLRNDDTKRSTEILSMADELQPSLGTKQPAWSPPEGGTRAGTERGTREASSLISAFWFLRRLSDTHFFLLDLEDEVCLVLCVCVCVCVCACVCEN